MKKFRFLLLLLVLPLCFIFTGCQEKVYVTGIEKTGSNGDVEYYTVYYSDGKTSNFSVENGKDGQDGKDLDLLNIYNYCINNNLYTGDFSSFLRDYLNKEQNDNSGIYSATNSIVSVAAMLDSTHAQVGAGVIYKIDEESNICYVITNFHVVANSQVRSLPILSNIKIWTYGDKNMLTLTDGISATCVGATADYDLAVLKVDTSKVKAKNKNASAVKLAGKYFMAEKLFAIGNPDGAGISITSGIVSVVSENISVTLYESSMSGGDVVYTYRVLRMDTPIYEGNSGGGLFNVYGELVGIVNAGAKDADNYNFALPIDNVRQVVSNLIYYAEKGTNTYTLKHFTMSDLGVVLEDSFVESNSQGDRIYDVIIDTLDIRLQNDFRVGDKILSITIDGNEHEIREAYQLDDYLISVRPNSTVSFKVLRNSLTNNIELTSSQISSLL